MRAKRGLNLRLLRFYSTLLESQSSSFFALWTSKWLRSGLSLSRSWALTPRIIVAVDETVVKRDGRPLYVWVGVNAQTIKPIWFGVSFTQTTQNSNSSKSEKNLLWQSCVVLRDRGL